MIYHDIDGQVRTVPNNATWVPMMQCYGSDSRSELIPGWSFDENGRPAGLPDWVWRCRKVERPELGTTKWPPRSVPMWYYLGGSVKGDVITSPDGKVSRKFRNTGSVHTLGVVFDVPGVPDILDQMAVQVLVIGKHELEMDKSSASA